MPYSFARRVSSNFAQTAASFSRSGSPRRYASQSGSIGTSVRMVVRNFEVIASSRPANTFSASLPLILPTLAMTPSTSPNFAMRSAAVFSPTPRMPGMLSDASPASAR